MRAMIMKFFKSVGTLGFLIAVAYAARQRKAKTEDITEKNEMQEASVYEKYIKRGADIICSLLTIICFGWLYVVIAILVKINIGSPILFIQPRPGRIDSKSGKEKIFDMYKFRTMTDETDKNGELLPDEQRMTKFGAWLRSSSLDELPEVFNILRGDMSVIGPRPQLVRDMVFMSDEQRKRHRVRPGLSGLAQVEGRNEISWEDKFEKDLEYIKNISFRRDIEIILKTVQKAFIMREGITEDGMVTARDLGDYLLEEKRITKQEYDLKQEEAREILAFYINSRSA